MKLHELKNTFHRQARKRVGRGDGSGNGRTAGRGDKGAGARSGAKRRPYFEGGQIPLIRRLPKRGFNNPDHVPAGFDTTAADVDGNGSITVSDAVAILAIILGDPDSAE